MKGFNQVILLGNLGRDPEIRFTGNGNSICTFTVATNHTYKDNEGKRKEKTEWHRVVAFGKLAEVCGEYLNKGEGVFIEGSLNNQHWESRNGEKRERTVVVVSKVRFLYTKEMKTQQEVS